MNDFDLDSKLKALHVPERDADYWEMFPRRVLARTRVLPARNASRAWRPRLAWGGGIAFALLVISFSSCPGLRCPIQTLACAMHNVKAIRMELARLPQQARALMRIDHGMPSLIEDQP